MRGELLAALCFGLGAALLAARWAEARDRLLRRRLLGRLRCAGVN